jgi:pimeloyl-ACP methyl ester carboxylesterase
MKKTSVAVLALALSMVFGAVAPAFAVKPTITYGNADDMPYTQITGTLDGAAYIIQIPDTWNGMLVVACPWYQLPPNRNCHLQYQPLSEELLAMGYAFACSNYGADGYPVQKGMIRIHQLTEYVIDNYHVSGKVFVIGGSMGGNIALLLGEKYPNLYSGVLDMCGTKDCLDAYTGTAYFATLTPEEISEMLEISLSDAEGFLYFCASISHDFIVETGGTPETKLKAYERISPTYNAHIQIPVITIIGELDATLPMFQNDMYQAAIDAAGCSDLYSQIIVPAAGHVDVDPRIFAEAIVQLPELVAWSDSLD